MRVLHGIVLLIVSHFSLGKLNETIVRPGGVIDQDVNDPNISSILEKKLRGTTPNELKNEKGMILVKLTKAQSQVVDGVQWFYEFEARGSSSNYLYNCKLVLLQQPWRKFDRVTKFSCNKVGKNM